MNKRINWIDMAKGYGTILVILGHLIKSGFVRYEIYSFHMPLFFFLAGYVFSPTKYNCKDFITKKLRTLIVPYFFMGTIISFCMWIFHGEYSLSDFIDCFVPLFVQKRFQAIWFLTCLFFTEIIMFLLVKITHNNYKKLLVTSCIMAILGFFYYELSFEALPWNIDICLIAIFYFTIGYITKQTQLFEKAGLFSAKKIIIITGILLQFSLVAINAYIFNDYPDMFYNRYACIPITLLASILGIALIVYISNLKCIKPISYIGKHSLIYFGWHNALIIPILTIVYKALGIFQTPDTPISCTIYVLVTTILLVALLTIVDVLIRKTKLKLFLGIK